MRVFHDLGNAGFAGGWLKRSRMLALAIKPLLEASVVINRRYLRAFPQTPPIYQAGVVYQNEPPDQGFEDFAVIPAMLKRGWGDCDDLAPWRVAELQERGENARIRIQWKKLPGKGKLYHIVVRRGDGRIEDPSYLLGMGNPRRKAQIKAARSRRLLL